jgi:tetratricopeptide (TPR) repeat protein
MRRQLAIIRTRQAGAASAAIWDDVFAATPDLPPQLDALRALATLAGEGFAVQNVFERHRTRLLAEHRGEQQNVYLLCSLKVFAAKARGDWPAALAAIAELRRRLHANQIPGVNLEEAAVRWRLGQSDAALRLLESNRRVLPVHDPVRADSALLAAEIYAAVGRLDRARTALREAAGTADANSVAYAAAKVANALNDPAQANAFLVEIAATLTGNGRGLVLVELAKLALAQGDRATAREYFVTAQKLLTDPALVAWVKQSICDLDQN